MRREIVPFRAEHLAPAAELLAARHRADRDRAPALPVQFSDAAQAGALIARALAEPDAVGVVALAGGRPAGYLIGSPVLPPPEAMYAQFIRPRSARIGYAGHAVDPADGVETYREMYAALAPRWLRYGCFSHYVEAPYHNDIVREAWFSLGFGDDIIAAVRDTGPVAGAGTDAALEIHRAGAEDIDVIMALVRGLAQHHASSPMFFPYLPETEPDARRFQLQMLAGPGGAQFLGYAGGRPVALQTLTSSLLGEMVTPEQSVYLFQGYTEPDARGSGAATAVLAQAMDWARAEGYRRCTLHYLSANVLGEQFWGRHGFRPMEVRLFRQIDERIAWANGAESG